MENTITLMKEVLIDGEPVRELAYDVEKITPEQFVQAEAYAASAGARLGKINAKPVELDAGFHYYLGAMAILAANPGFDIADVERVKGPDILKVMAVGRNFMTGDAEEDEDEDSATPEEEGDEGGIFLQQPEFGD